MELLECLGDKLFLEMKVLLGKEAKLINWQNHMIFQKESEIVELVKTNIPEDKISAEQVLQSKVAN